MGKTANEVSDYTWVYSFMCCEKLWENERKNNFDGVRVKSTC